MNELESLAELACRASDRARAEILPRFRDVAVELKADGSPVTEADRAAERAIREVLLEARPEIPVVGEEYGGEAAGAPRHWLVDPIDGTISFSRGIGLYSSLVTLVEEGHPVVALIDLPSMGERYVGWRDGGCHLNGRRVRASSCADMDRAMVVHGDRPYFERFGEPDLYRRLFEGCRTLRGYCDGFGHAQLLHGGVDAMVDLDLNPWDAAPAQLLVPEAGGRCETLEKDGRLGLVMGSPPLVERILAWR